MRESVFLQLLDQQADKQVLNEIVEISWPQRTQHNNRLSTHEPAGMANRQDLLDINFNNIPQRTPLTEFSTLTWKREENCPTIGVYIINEELVLIRIYFTLDQA